MVVPVSPKGVTDTRVRHVEVRQDARWAMAAAEYPGTIRVTTKTQPKPTLLHVKHYTENI